MLAFMLSVAAAAPPAPVLPADEERLGLESLDHLRLDSSAQQVPAWPDTRPFRRRDDGTLVGLAIAAVSGVLVASVIPDRVVLRERWYYSLSSCERKQAAGLLIGCI